MTTQQAEAKQRMTLKQQIKEAGQIAIDSAERSWAAQAAGASRIVLAKAAREAAYASARLAELIARRQRQLTPMSDYRAEKGASSR